MKRFCLLVAFLLLAGWANAQTPDDQYVEIYHVIQKASTLEANNEITPALAAYREAQTALARFQKGYPGWNPSIVGFRLTYLASKVETLSAQITAQTAPTAPVTKPAPTQPGVPPDLTERAELQRQIATLQEEVRQLLAEKTVLEAKLKEALAVKPAATDPQELARALDRIRVLERENEALKASGPVKEQAEAVEAKPGADYERQVSALRSRIEILESRPIPYTDEELALFRDSPAGPAVAPVQRQPTAIAPDVAALMADAKRAFAAGDLDKAESSYQAVIQQDPANIVSLGDLAAIKIRRGQLDEAERLLNQALNAAPNDPFSLSTLGLVKFQKKQLDEAMDLLSRAAQWDPKNPQIQNRLGLVLSEKGLRAPAETALRKAIQLEPGYAEAHHNLAVVYITQKPPMKELARWHYQKAIAGGQAKNPELEQMLDAK